jgi:hypothetical protein
MKMTIESTDLITEVQNITCRIWRGVTEAGTAVDVVVPLIRVRANAKAEDLERELKEIPAREVARSVGLFDKWDGPIDLRRVI